MSALAWTDEERAWARECFSAGDTPEEIGEAAGRSADDVWRAIGRPRRLTAHQREVLRLYSAGATFLAVADELGRVGPTRGKIVSMTISRLRRRGLAIPYRIEQGAGRRVGGVCA